MKIIDIEGIGETYAKTLEGAGIAKVEDLIPLTWGALKNLAEKTDISFKLLEKWQDQAEIMIIDGVGPEYSEVLNKIGIDSTLELAYRNPEKTLEKVVALDKEQPDVIRKIPTVDDIKRWIDEAKKNHDIKKEKTAPKGMKVIELEGIGNKYSKTLSSAGAPTVESLLGLDKAGIKALAEKTKISEKLIDKWAEHADLMRIGGVGPEYAEVLNEIGVDSVKELAQRNPKNTLDKIMALDKEKPDVFRRPPTLNAVEGWIAEAKEIK